MRGKYREDGAQKILREATTVFAELFSQKAAFFRGTVTDGSLPRNAPLRWLQNTKDLGACTPPFLNDWQIATSFDLLQQTIHKPGELPKRQIASIGTPRVQFSDVVCN